MSQKHSNWNGNAILAKLKKITALGLNNFYCTSARILIQIIIYIYIYIYIIWQIYKSLTLGIANLRFLYIYRDLRLKDLKP